MYIYIYTYIYLYRFTYVHVSLWISWMISSQLTQQVLDSGTVSLDTEGLRQELGFALVCARRFEEAIGVLGQVPGGLGSLGTLGTTENPEEIG